MSSSRSLLLPLLLPLLLLAATCLGCGGSPAVVDPVRVTRAHAAAQAALPVVPQDALGVYASDEESGWFLALQQIGERLFLVVPGRRAVVVQAARNAAGFSLIAPAALMNAPEDEPQLPNSFSLVATTPGQPSWQLESPLGTLTHRLDPFAAEIAANLRNLELVGLNEKGVDTRDDLQRGLHLLREHPRKAWQDVVNSNDPEQLRLRGGVRGVWCDELGFALDGLRPAASGQDAARLQRYVDAAKKAPTCVQLWPPSDDAFLFALADRQLLSQETLRFTQGTLLSLGTLDHEHVAGCDLAVIIPEPTENRARPWAPFVRPAQAQLGAFTYVGLVLQSGTPGSCNALEPSRDMYPVRHGVYYFRLLANARAQTQGLEFVSYMAVSLFVRRSIVWNDLVRALEVLSEDIAHQAE